MVLRNIKLILIGGSETKKEDYKILKKAFELVNYENIVLIPTASYYPNEIIERYEKVFKKINLTNYRILDIRYNYEGNDKKFIQAINKAKLIFFTGGDQAKLIETIKGTELEKTIKEMFLNDQVIVMGTSAGAAALGEISIFDGDYEPFIKGVVKTIEGFGLIKEVIVDTHFNMRERLHRLVQGLSLYMNYKGIGIDENTAIFVDKNYTFEVVGDYLVTLLNPSELTYNDIFEVENYKLFNVNNFKIGFISEGTIFSIKEWKILKPQNNVLNIAEYDKNILHKFLSY